MAATPQRAKNASTLACRVRHTRWAREGEASGAGVGGASGVWAADEAAGRVYYLSEQVPEDVWVPIQSRLVTVEGRSNVSFESVTFVDVDFSASGVQTGFNDRLSDAGCPHDASVAISNSRDVSIQGCAFTAVGGCGVLAMSTAGRRKTRRRCHGAFCSQ